MPKFIANLIWKIAKISPKTGNMVMDTIGYENYCKVAKVQTVTVSRATPDEAKIDSIDTDNL